MKSISELVLDYFSAHPNEELRHAPVVDWVTEQYLKEHSSPPRDPWRAIRLFHQQGILIKVKKGVYKYNPSSIKERILEDFSPQQREAIYQRDEYRCVICGQGRVDGVEIHVDHIIPKELGGKAYIENGQTLCATHNFRKKTYKQTETGKRMFIHLYELAMKQEDEKIVRFCQEILELYKKHQINDHIQWENT